MEELNNDPHIAFDKLVDYLARRDHSEKELKEKLRRKFTETALLEALEEARTRKYLANPVELAERVCESLHRKNKGYLYICNYLKEKGLPSVLKNNEIEQEKARDFLSTKIQKMSPLKYEDKAKLIRWLKNRGFDLETINSVVNNIDFQSSKDYE